MNIAIGNGLGLLGLHKMLLIYYYCHINKCNRNIVKTQKTVVVIPALYVKKCGHGDDVGNFVQLFFSFLFYAK